MCPVTRQSACPAAAPQAACRCRASPPAASSTRGGCPGSRTPMSRRRRGTASGRPWQLSAEDPMLIYIVRRILYAVPVALGVALVVFMLVHLAPGDPISAILPPDAPQELVIKLTAYYGFD